MSISAPLHTPTTCCCPPLPPAALACCVCAQPPLLAVEVRTKPAGHGGAAGLCIAAAPSMHSLLLPKFNIWQAA